MCKGFPNICILVKERGKGDMYDAYHNEKIDQKRQLSKDINNLSCSTWVESMPKHLIWDSYKE